MWRQQHDCPSELLLRHPSRLAMTETRLPGNLRAERCLQSRVNTEARLKHVSTDRHCRPSKPEQRSEKLARTENSMASLRVLVQAAQNVHNSSLHSSRRFGPRDVAA